MGMTTLVLLLSRVVRYPQIHCQTLVTLQAILLRFDLLFVCFKAVVVILPSKKYQHMNARRLITSVFLIISFAHSVAQVDTIKVGAYVLSVHDINFHDKEYTARFWLWFIYNNPKYDFTTQLDMPTAKSYEQSPPITDSLDGKAWVMMKMKATMKEKWNVQDFPFDQQHLSMQIENSQYDTSSMIFVADTQGSRFSPTEAIDGWNIQNFKVTAGTSKYETGFGDSRPGRNPQTFSTFLIEMNLQRDALGLFMKIFLGMYIAFLIAMISFAPKPWEHEPRFGLPVGGLFAAVGNKYIIDSLLPESSTFTLVDSLHTLTFFAIFSILLVSAICLRLYDDGKKEKCLRVNKIGSRTILILYILINLIFVGTAVLN
jgi:hypothetical protein